MNERRLWYKRPAADWNEALPLGNGRLGMMVFGGIEREVLQLNEETLWSGCPHDADNPDCFTHLSEIRSLLFAGEYAEAQALCDRYLVCTGKGSEDDRFGSYATAGDLIIESLLPVDSSDYSRSLDIFDGLAVTECSGFSRRHLVSDKYDVTLSRLAAPHMELNISFSREGVRTEYDGCTITVQGNNLGESFCTVVRLEGASECVASEGGLAVKAEGTLVICTATATTYNQADPLSVCRERIGRALAVGFDTVAAENAEYMNAAMGTSRLDLGSDGAPDTPTDERLSQLSEAQPDAGLSELYFNYGKYLLICSSKGQLPANLQGIWADGIYTPWNGDFHININLQMNYWHAETLGLAAYCEPLFRYIRFLSEQGRDTARVQYGCRGWVAHTLANPWGFTAPGQSPSWGSFMCAGAWCCRHLYEHYLFTGDLDFLREYYPVMKECARFFLDFLVEDPSTGCLVTAPSNSPENSYFVPGTQTTAAICAGPTMDNTILYELFGFTAESARLLGETDGFAEECLAAQRRLPPIKVGRHGQIMEWQQDFDEPEPGHRHISHLYGLYPAGVITESASPELYAAARVTLDRRLSSGGGHTGWSRAWIINFFARLHDGQRAGENLAALFSRSTLKNLFDNHPPFQIDGNFGGTAGICEMLIQSYQGFVELLPALPPSWRSGSFSGLRARGGFIFDVSWSGGLVESCRVTSLLGKPLELRFNGRAYSLRPAAGETFEINI